MRLTFDLTPRSWRVDGTGGVPGPVFYALEWNETRARGGTWVWAKDKKGRHCIVATVHMEIGDPPLTQETYALLMNNLVILCEIEYAKQTGGG